VTRSECRYFFRDPLACHFTFLDRTALRNDLIVIGSSRFGQKRPELPSHAGLRKKLKQALTDGTFPPVRHSYCGRYGATGTIARLRISELIDDTGLI
jgi:hypothetical protein